METGVWNVEQRLRFAVEFAKDNLDRYRAVDWAVLREDLKEFLNVTFAKNFGETMLLAKSFDDSASEADLRKIQSDLKRLLSMFVGMPERLRGKEAAAWMATELHQPPISVNLTYMPVKGAGVLFQGPLRDLVLAITVKLLQQGETSRVVRCPMCDAIFYRHRKQLFCSRRCTNRAMIQRMRERERAKKSKKKKGVQKKHGRHGSTQRR